MTMHSRYTPWALGGTPRTAAQSPATPLWQRLYDHAVRWRLLYAVAGSLAVFTVSSLPVRLPSPVSAQDKVLHALAYFVIGITYVNACAPGWRHITTTRALVALAALALFAVSDEVHQAFVPQRVSDPADVLADVIGGAAAVLLGWLAGVWLRRTTRRQPAANAA